MDDAITLASLLIGFVFIGLALLLPRLVRSKGGAQADNTLNFNVPDEQVRALEKVEDATLRLEEMARELFGRLDTRSRVLIRLIEEAEVRSKELGEAIQRDKESQ